MPEVWTPLLIGVVGVAIVLYGFSKTAMPVAAVVGGLMLAAALGPTVAAGFALPLLILGDLIGLFRQHANWRLIRQGGARCDCRHRHHRALVRLCVNERGGKGHWRLAFGLGRPGDLPPALRSPALERLDQDSSVRRLEAGFYGTLTGVTTMAANAGGAAMTLYLVKMRVPMLTFMGTSVWFFFILNVIKLPFVIPLGLITRESLLVGLWFIPALVVGALLGITAFRRMNQIWFERIALTLSALASLWLVIRG